MTSLNLTPIRDEIENINTKIVFSTIVELIDKEMKKGEIEKIVLVMYQHKHTVS